MSMQPSVQQVSSTWAFQELQEVCEVRYGLGQPPEQDDEGIPMIRATNVKRGRITEAGLIRIKKSAIPESRNPYLKRGDIIVVRSGAYTGDVAMITEEWEGSVAGYDLIVSPRGSVDSAFCAYALLSPQVQRHFESLSNRAAQAHLNRQQLQTTPIPLPPLPEQKAIAHSLATVQRAIAAQEQIIQTTTELKKALMQKLFTEGLRGEPQKETEIGLVPESWGVAPLGEIARIERGKFSHRPRNDPRFYGGEHPFVQTGDVSNCDGYIRSYTQTLNNAGLAISKMFPAGTILITIAANIGFTGILEFDAACPDSLVGITPNDSLHSQYLNYYLMTQQPAMDRLAPKGTQKNINIQFLKPWPVPVPPLPQQVEIAKALSASDQKTNLAIAKRGKLKEAFAAILDRLFANDCSSPRIDSLIHLFS